MRYRLLAQSSALLLLWGLLAPSIASGEALDLRSLGDEPAERQIHEPAASPGRHPPGIQPSQFVPPLGVPPEPGDLVLEDALTTNQVVPTGRWCPTGKNSFESTEEGLLIKLQGKCQEQEASPQVAAILPGFAVPDGEISFEMKPTGGFERAAIAVMLRHGATPDDLYAVWWSPMLGFGGITKNARGTASSLMARSDLGQFFQANEWNTVAVRAQGPDIWLIVNGQPVVSVVDDALDSGRIGFRLFRPGDPNDEIESAVVLRNLRVSALVGSAESASPTYDATQSASQGASIGLAGAPAAGAPPVIGAVAFEDPLNGRGLVGAVFCPTGRNSAQFREDGYLMRVTGPCREGVAAPGAVASFVEGLTFADGEIQVDARLLSGGERASFAIATRIGPAGNDGYFAEVHPGRGVAALVKLVEGQPIVLAQRTDLAAEFGADDWIRVAVRFEGSSQWLLLNDQPVLSTVDSTYESGRTLLGVARLGDPLDDQEAAFVVRNLRVSALADGDPARAPSRL